MRLSIGDPDEHLEGHFHVQRLAQEHLAHDGNYVGMLAALYAHNERFHEYLRDPRVLLRPRFGEVARDPFRGGFLSVHLEFVDKVRCHEFGRSCLYPLIKVPFHLQESLD